MLPCYGLNIFQVRQFQILSHRVYYGRKMFEAEQQSDYILNSSDHIILHIDEEYKRRIYAEYCVPRYRNQNILQKK